MRLRHGAATLLFAAVLAAVAIHLYDPFWIGGVTSGLRNWETDSAGSRFRWTAGHASFFVPSDALVLVLPLRGGFKTSDGRPVAVAVSVDDRWLADLEVIEGKWIRPRLPLPRGLTRRRYRRVDLRVSHTVGQSNLGVQLGGIGLERIAPAR